MRKAGRPKGTGAVNYYSLFCFAQYGDVCREKEGRLCKGKSSSSIFIELFSEDLPCPRPS